MKNEHQRLKNVISGVSAATISSSSQGSLVLLGEPGIPHTNGPIVYNLWRGKCGEKGYKRLDPKGRLQLQQPPNDRLCLIEPVSQGQSRGLQGVERAEPRIGLHSLAVGRGSVVVAPLSE